MATSNMTVKSAVEQFSDSLQNRRLLEQERLFVEVTELLTSAMESRGITRAELAGRLGKTKAFVTQVLRGNHNMTLRTLAELFDALDCRVLMDAIPREATRASKSKLSTHWTFDAEPCWKHKEGVWESRSVACDIPSYDQMARGEFASLEVAA